MDKQFTIREFVNEWATIDNDQIVAASRTEEDIINDVLGEKVSDDEEVEVTRPTLITHSKALEASEILFSYFEQQGSRIRTQQMRSTMQEIKKNLNASKKQTSLENWLIKK